jgi:hypothetical protein
MSEFLDAAQASPYIAPPATPPGDLYFTFTKPDGDSFLASAAQAEGFLRLGYTVTGEQTLSDSDTFRNAVSPGAVLPPASGVDTTEATGTSGARPQTPPAA